MAMTEKEIVKSLKQLGKQYRSIKQDPIKERESYDMLLDSFKEIFPGNPKIHMNFYLAFRPVAVSLMALLIVGFSGFGLLKASENAVPGHFLYTFKRVAEKTQLVFAFNQSKKTALKAQILTNRLQEVKILAKNIEMGDTKAKPKLNTLTQQVTNEMQSLKREVASKVTPFPNDELLYIEDDLPVQDGRRIFTVNQTEDLERLLTQTHELLAEENLSAALVRIEEAIQVSQNKEPITEEDTTNEEEEKEDVTGENNEDVDSNESQEEPSIYKEDTTKKETLEEIKTKEPITDAISPIIEPELPSASTGELFQGIKTERSKEPNKEVGTGLIRERE
ncbi:hypothetical protein B6D52_01235 [Candidatus Parcubacteria bacterium 4484_255]|nr:MAG: hypothetical protein B6D52_01235 [Candidatus Parcubacteria bacterium 4484_255]